MSNENCGLFLRLGAGCPPNSGHPPGRATRGAPASYGFAARLGGTTRLQAARRCRHNRNRYVAANPIFRALEPAAPSRRVARARRSTRTPLHALAGLGEDTSR